jgi:Protein of unknown function (DUF2845)
MLIRGAVICFLLGLGLAPWAAWADSVNCGGGLVAVGDTRLDLVAKCGAPTLLEAEPVAPTGDPSLAIERWTYNFGPERFLQVVSLQGGRIIRIERGTYGYPNVDSARDADHPMIPRATCEPDAVHVGDRTFDVLAKCGEPFSRDLRPGHADVEVWTYDFGPESFIRFMDFRDGTLIRVRSGGYGYST